MTIIKRDGKKENYDSQKIVNAMRKAFSASGEKCDEKTLSLLLDTVEEKLGKKEGSEVETIQDKVEEALMEKGFFKTARGYILFREERTRLREERASLIAAFKEEDIESSLIRIQKEFPEQEYSLRILENKFLSFYKSGMSDKEKRDALIKAAVELTKPEFPKWEIIAARFLNYSFKKELKASMEKRHISSFYDKISYLASEGLYGTYILKGYSKDEIEMAASFIDEERENLFTYAGLELLLKRYVIKSHQGERPRGVLPDFFLLFLPLLCYTDSDYKT